MKKTKVMPLSLLLMSGVASGQTIMNGESIPRALKSSRVVKHSSFDINVKKHCHMNRANSNVMSCDLKSIFAEAEDYIKGSATTLSTVRILNRDGNVLKDRSGNVQEFSVKGLDETEVSLPLYSRLLIHGKRADGRQDYMVTNVLTTNPLASAGEVFTDELDPFINVAANEALVEANKYRICVRGEYNSVDLSPTNEYYNTKEGIIAYRGLSFLQSGNTVFLDEFGCANFSESEFSALNGNITLQSKIKIVNKVNNNTMSSTINDIYKDAEGFQSYEDYIDIIKTADGVNKVASASTRPRKTEVAFDQDAPKKGDTTYILVPNTDFFTGLYGAWGFAFYRYVFDMGKNAPEKVIDAKPCYSGMYNYGSCSGTYSPFKEVYLEVTTQANTPNYSYKGTWKLPLVSEFFYGLAHEIGHAVDSTLVNFGAFGGFYPKSYDSIPKGTPNEGYPTFKSVPGLCDWKGLGSHAAHSYEPIAAGVKEGVAHWLSWLVFNEIEEKNGKKINCVDTATGEVIASSKVSQKCVDIWMYYKTPDNKFPNLPLDNPDYLTIASKQKYPYGVQVGAVYGLDWKTTTMLPVKDDFLANDAQFGQYFKKYQGGSVDHDAVCGFKENKHKPGDTSKNLDTYYVSELGVQRFGASLTILLKNPTAAGQIITKVFTECGPAFKAGQGMTEMCVNHALQSVSPKLTNYQFSKAKETMRNLGWINYVSDKIAAP